MPVPEMKMELIEEHQIHPESLKEQTPQFFHVFTSGIDLVASYGWYILGIGAFGLYAWYTWLEPRYRQWRSALEENEYAAKYHKDPDMALERQQAMEAARERMQQKNDAKAAEFLEKMKQKEETRRQEKEAERARLGLGGYILGSSINDNLPPSTGNSHSSSLRPEYNPLRGDERSGGYRAPRRSCPGGGCN